MTMVKQIFPADDADGDDGNKGRKKRQNDDAHREVFIDIERFKIQS